MALRWIEGWEGATTTFVNHARLYATATGTAIAENGASEPLGEAISSDDALFVTPVFAGGATNSWVIGLAFRPEDNATISVTQAAYVAMGNTDGEQIRFEFIDANPATSKPGGLYYTVRAMRGAVELATCTQKFPMGAVNNEQAWVYFEFKMTIDNAVGSFEGRFQFTQKGSLNPSGAPVTMLWDAASSGIDTQDQTSTGADRFTLSMNTGNTGHEVATDDIYVLDTTGAKNNDFLGKVIIEGQKPSTVGGGDGDTVAWTLAGGALDTHDAWDEALTGTEDDERLTSDVTTEIHLCVVDPLDIILAAAATIVGVRQDLIAHMETATGNINIAQMWRKTTATAGETGSGTLNVDSTTYEGLATILEDDPNTVLAWAQADLDSYQYGVRNDG